MPTREFLPTVWKENRRGRWYAVDSLAGACYAGLLIWTLMLSSSEMLHSCLSLRMASVLLRGPVVLILSISFWHQWKSLSLLAQILHPGSTDFLASITDLWAFPVQVLDPDLHEPLLWALDLLLDPWRTFSWAVCLQIDPCRTSLWDPVSQLDSLDL